MTSVLSGPRAETATPCGQNNYKASMWCKRRFRSFPDVLEANSPSYGIKSLLEVIHANPKAFLFSGVNQTQTTEL